MRISSISCHPESRHFEKKDIPKSSDRAHDDRKAGESSSKKTSQGQFHVSDNEFRRFAGQSENSRYACKSLSPKVEEPAEKKFRDDASERKIELEDLQKQKLQQQMSMLK